MTPVPELTVVVPSVNGAGDLLGCLDALAGERDGMELEVIVVDRCGEGVRAQAVRRHPWIHMIAVPSTTSIPQMRAMAFVAATADSVAVIEDHVIVPRGWARALLDAQRETAAVVGGSVDNAATDRLVDWAAFLCEYSHCLAPLPAGHAEWLTGNNVVYRRDLLERYRQVIEAGKWENYLHDALKRDGVPLICRPEICVGHKKHYTIGEYLTQRYLYARSYAGERVKEAPLSRRLAFGLAAFALPPLLLWRTVSRVLKKGRYRAHLLRSLPLLTLFVGSWSLGEVVGYWAGPSDSLARVC